jgi:hypothetical protein
VKEKHIKAAISKGIVKNRVEKDMLRRGKELFCIAKEKQRLAKTSNGYEKYFVEMQWISIETS